MIPAGRDGTLYEAIAEYLAQRAGEFEMIDAARRARLEALSQFIGRERLAAEAARLIFICTHNSRRSHMAHLWATVAAVNCGLSVAAYSGGTTATAFNPRAVAALRRAGFRIEPPTAGENPTYSVRFGNEWPPLACFSKRYDAAPNPKADFAAVMVCGEADAACPVVPGAAARFSIPFVDPKLSDGTPDEAAVYDQRCAQIACEMLYVMSEAAR